MLESAWNYGPRGVYSFSRLRWQPEVWDPVVSALVRNHSLLVSPFSHTKDDRVTEMVRRNRSELARAVIYHTATSLPDDVIGVILEYIVVSDENLIATAWT